MFVLRISDDTKVKCRTISTKSQVRMKYKESKREYKKRIQVEWKLSAPAQTGPGAHLAS